ncbi:hypothetical protein J3R83DRAFT_4152 [Lanmaoa asiatica]|nr:hypothetical protein J3R83DRAFT_4152 [Lanmaoa asiatica]
MDKTIQKNVILVGLPKTSFRERNPPSPARFDYDDPIGFLERIFENLITNLHATLDVIQASLPALMERFASSDEPGSHYLGEDEEIMDNSIDPPKLLEDSLIMYESPSPLLRREIAYNLTFESLPERVSSPTRTPSFPETRTASQPTVVSSSYPPPSQPQYARLSSRFSTVMSTHNRRTFIIDISDDDEDEDEEEEEYAQYTLGIGSINFIGACDELLYSLQCANRKQKSHCR